MLWRILSILGAVLAVVWLAGCAAAPARPPLRVVATIAPLADWAEQVGQQRVQVTRLVPVDRDPRTYVPSDADLAALRDADVVLANGLGLEPWLGPLLARVQPSRVIVLELAEFMAPAQVVQGGGQTAGARQRGVGSVVPAQNDARLAPMVFSNYFWLDPGPTGAQLAVTLIADTLIRADPQALAFYRRNAERYNGELENLDTWILRQIRAWPRLRLSGARAPRLAMQAPERSWYYFARRYGIDLRASSELTNLFPALPPETPLLVDAFGATIVPGVRPGQQPDAMLRPLGNASYVRLMRDNVRSMAQAFWRAAQEQSSQRGRHDGS